MRPEDAPLFAGTPQAAAVLAADRELREAKGAPWHYYRQCLVDRAVAEAELGAAVLGAAEVIRQLSAEVRERGRGSMAFEVLLRLDRAACERAWAWHHDVDPDRTTAAGHGWHVGRL